MSEPVIRVGLLGVGTVGSSLVSLLEQRSDEIAKRRGVRIEVTRAAVRDLTKVRNVNLPHQWLTIDAEGIVVDPEVDVIVELIGGISPAYQLVSTALRAGKPVITGNKALIAEHGAELFGLAAENNVDLLFEAAVAGGIPIVRPLRESLVGEPLQRVMGILNGTTNFILSQMSELGTSYEAALAEAQELGYAEADPTADVGGHDAAAKAAIIATIAFGASVTPADVFTEGIENITAEDISYAADLGYCIKLLGIIERVELETISVRVHPAMVPKTHPLASVRDSFNAVFVEGDAVGELMFYGRGAGGDPTASAVLGDLIDASVNTAAGTAAILGIPGPADVVSIEQLLSAFYLSIDVADQPGVLADVAGVLAAHGVSISSLEQLGLGDNARIAFITHQAKEVAMDATLADLKNLNVVKQINSVLRVIDAT